MSRASRDKGNRTERAIVRLLQIAALRPSVFRFPARPAAALAAMSACPFSVSIAESKSSAAGMDSVNSINGSITLTC
jgi:hypothetical protein